MALSIYLYFFQLKMPKLIQFRHAQFNFIFLKPSITSLINMGNFGEFIAWFGGQGAVNKIVYVLAVLLTVVGILGVLIYYAAWKSHYFWMYDDKYYKQYDSKDLNKWISSFRSKITTVIALVSIALACFIILIVLWLVLQNGAWKYALFAGIALSVVASIICYVLHSKTGEKFNGDLWAIKAKVMSDNEYKYCDAAELIDINVQRTEKKNKDFDTDDAEKYCSSSNGINLSMAAILLLGAVFDLIAFFLGLKQQYSALN